MDSFILGKIFQKFTGLYPPGIAKTDDLVEIDIPLGALMNKMAGELTALGKEANVSGFGRKGLIPGNAAFRTVDPHAIGADDSDPALASDVNNLLFDFRVLGPAGLGKAGGE